jgi:hypothetical protein
MPILSLNLAVGGEDGLSLFPPSIPIRVSADSPLCGIPVWIVAYVLVRPQRRLGNAL